MIEEWSQTGERMVPFVLRFDYSDYDGLLKELADLKAGINLAEHAVSSSTYWLIGANKRVLGAVNIRHRLNSWLLERGGHIGYGIRPSERRKGHATQLLSLALEEAKKMGIEKALVTCDKNNVGSAKTIRNNGGELESEPIVDGVAIQRYWIHT
ncbi:GNAT family N-acetyltransferase [Paenibacillus marinisediminis]